MKMKQDAHCHKEIHTEAVNLLSESGTDTITPLPVPIQSRLQEVMRQLMRTNEKPSLPLPEENIKT